MHFPLIIKEILKNGEVKDLTIMFKMAEAFYIKVVPKLENELRQSFPNFLSSQCL